MLVWLYVNRPFLIVVHCVLIVKPTLKAGLTPRLSVSWPLSCMTLSSSQAPFN